MSVFRIHVLSSSANIFWWRGNTTSVESVEWDVEISSWCNLKPWLKQSWDVLHALQLDAASGIRTLISSCHGPKSVLRFRTTNFFRHWPRTNDNAIHNGCSELKVFFCRQEVCVELLKKSFHFSTGLVAIDHANVIRMGQKPKSRALELTEGQALVCGISPHWEAIISYLLLSAKDWCEKISVRQVLHLAFQQKTDNFRLFFDQYEQLYKDSPPTPHYFPSVLKQDCLRIKVQKCSEFAIRDVCKEVCAGLKKALGKD